MFKLCTYCTINALFPILTPFFTLGLAFALANFTANFVLFKYMQALRDNKALICGLIDLKVNAQCKAK